MPNFRSIGPFKQELQSCVRFCPPPPPPYQSAKISACLGLKSDTEQNTHRKLSVDIESTINPFFPASFLPKTLSANLIFVSKL